MREWGRGWGGLRRWGREWGRGWGGLRRWGREWGRGWGEGVGQEAGKGVRWGGTGATEDFAVHLRM